MTRTDINAVLAAANPLTECDAAALPLHDAEVDLVERIAAIPVRPRPPRASVTTRRRRRLALVLGATAVLAAVLMLVPSGDRGGGPAPAFAAPLVRFAKASPLVLLELPGWHVVYADEQPGAYGEMHFVHGAADANGNPQGASYNSEASLGGRVAQLNWAPATPADRRYLAGGHQHAATGLGVTAQRFIREGGGPGWLDITAQFIAGNRALRFRATVTDMEMFRSELRALAAVDTTTWLRAMPPSVVKAADSGETIRQMLKGIPLPPGFDAAKIRGARLVHNRYDLGAAVTGTIACMWIADWSRARTTGNSLVVRRAIAAMATAPTWPILHEMEQQGAWPQVLISIAQAMPSGTVGGRPLADAVNSGLGCKEWGVRLEPQPRSSS